MGDLNRSHGNRNALCLTANAVLLRTAFVGREQIEGTTTGVPSSHSWSPSAVSVLVVVEMKPSLFIIVCYWRTTSGEAWIESMRSFTFSPCTVRVKSGGGGVWKVEEASSFRLQSEAETDAELAGGVRLRKDAPVVDKRGQVEGVERELQKIEGLEDGLHGRR